MKTLTEFTGFHLREAHAKSSEISKAIQSGQGTEGKTAEELASAHREALGAFLTERFKLEGDRLNLFMEAMELTGTKPRDLENLKRVVVYAVTEGEKTPSQVQIRGAHGFAAEYLAPLRGPDDRRKNGSKHGPKGAPKGDKKKKGRGKRRPDLKGKRPDGAPERRGPQPGAQS